MREEDGIVEVCAVLSGATLQRDTQVTFLTQDSTATSVSSELKLTLTVTNSNILFLHHSIRGLSSPFSHHSQ